MLELIDSPTERTTAATDALLALLCAGCVLYLHRFRTQDAWKVRIWTWAFALLGVAGLLGAAVHGFVLGDSVRPLLWGPLYLCLGLAVALFGTGAIHDAAGERAARDTLPVLAAIALGFFALTRLAGGGFLLFVLYEAVVMLLALAAYAWLAATNRLPGAAWMAGGILLTLLAATLQATRVTPRLELIWIFDHNGLFHLVQMPALILLTHGLGTAVRGGPSATGAVPSA